MSEDLGPIVIDPHAFKRLWPILGVWLVLFAVGGDPRTVLGRELALWFGAPAEATIVDKRIVTERRFTKVRRYLVDFTYEHGGAKRRASEPVGSRWQGLKPGMRRAIRVRGDAAYLEDDLGYTRWKLFFFGGSFVALWLWAAGRYRFG